MANQIKKAKLEIYLQKYGYHVTQKHYETLERLIDEVGLSKYKQKIIELAEPCIRICTLPYDKKNIKPGMSYFGGLPDLPDDIPWPERAPGEPLSFLGQINLEDVAKFECANMLPESGLLQFYYHSDQDASGWSLKHKKYWKTVYIAPRETSNKKRKSPVNHTQCDGEVFELYNPTKIVFYETLCLPAYDSEKLNALTFDDQETSAFFYDLKFKFIRNTVVDTGDGFHQLLGEAQTVQVSLTDRLKELDKNDFILLLQIGGDENLDWVWWDSGRLFFLMSKKGLTQGNWNEVWMILESY